MRGYCWHGLAFGEVIGYRDGASDASDPIDSTMPATTLMCPTCGPVQPTDNQHCPTCEASLAEQAILQQIEALRQATAQLGQVTAQAKKPLSTSVNGTGTMLLDYRKRNEDTYTATRWIAFFYLPLIPLAQYHIRPIAQNPQPMQRTYRFDVLGKEGLEASSVLKTYGLAIIGVVPLLFAFLQMDLVNDLVGEGPGFFVTLGSIVWFVFIWFRFMNADKAFKKP